MPLLILQPFLYICIHDTHISVLWIDSYQQYILWIMLILQA